MYMHIAVHIICTVVLTRVYHCIYGMSIVFRGYLWVELMPNGRQLRIKYIIELAYLA